MKYLIVADLHFDKHESFSNIALGSFLLDKTAQFIIDTVVKYKPDYIVFAGDTFNTKTPAIKHIIKFKKLILDKLSDKKIIIIPGNHDNNFHDQSSLFELFDNIQFVPDKFILQDGRFKIGFYGYNLLNFVTEYDIIPDIIICHEALPCKKYPSVPPTIKEDVFIKLAESCELIIAGHVHMYNTVKLGKLLGIVPGSVLPCNIPQINDKRYMVLLNVLDDKFKFELISTKSIYEKHIVLLNEPSIEHVQEYINDEQMKVIVIQTKNFAKYNALKSDKLVFSLIESSNETNEVIDKCFNIINDSSVQSIIMSYLSLLPKHMQDLIMKQLYSSNGNGRKKINNVDQYIDMIKMIQNFNSTINDITNMFAKQ